MERINIAYHELTWINLSLHVLTWHILN